MSLSGVPTTTSDRVFLALRAQILHGELKPGTRLIQRQLAAEFGTSNIPIVESIRRLERDGLLITHPKWGAEVNRWSPEDIEAIYVMRASLEGTTCKLFARQATDAQRLTLQAHGRHFEMQAARGDLRAANEADIALHLYIVECTQSNNLYRMAETSCVITATLRNLAWLQDEAASADLIATAGVHRDLIEALCSGDAKRAQRVGRAHVQNALAGVMAALDGKLGFDTTGATGTVGAAGSKKL